MREEKTALLKRKEDLELQSNELNLPFPEARERFMNRIKQDNAEIKQQDKEVADLRKMIDNYNRNNNNSNNNNNNNDNINNNNNNDNSNNNNNNNDKKQQQQQQ